MPSTATSVLDGLSTSVAVKAPCRAVAITNITLSGLQTVNGVAVVEDDRVLVTAQTSAVNNGIYVASTGQWQRALDFDGQRDAVQGTLVLVLDNDGIGYELTTADPVVIGTSSITFAARDIDSALRAELAAGTAGLVDSLSITYDRTAAEIAAAVTPTTAASAYETGDPRRYATAANAAAVYAQINTLARYTGWFRGDRAQHQQLTNVILGLGAYDDSRMTGTLGYRCTAIGVDTLKQNSTSTLAGGSNTAVGYQSMRDSVDTSGNTGVGTSTLASCTGVSSSHNGAFGNSTLEALVAGTQNNAFAYRAMYQLIRGNNNSAFGDVCLQGLIAGSANNCYGAQAGFTKQAGLYLHAFGYQACFHEISATISGISKAGSAVVTISTVSVSNPYAVNDYVVVNDVSGMTQINEVAGIVTAIGGSSGAWTVTVAINSSAFSTYTSGGYLSPIGNCAFGYKNQFENTYASGNSTFGYEVGSTSALGIANSIFGFQAGRVINLATFNSLFGWRAGLAISSGSSNCFFGQQAGIATTTGSTNVYIGPSAGSGNTTGSDNVAIGNGAGTATGTNRIAIGKNAQCIADNQVTLGDGNVTVIRAQVTTITAISDIRDKMNARPASLGLDFINAVQVREFEWNRRDGLRVGDRDMGIIAQELQTLSTAFGAGWLGLVSEVDPEHLEATPGKLLFPAIRAIQELSARVVELEARLAA